MVRPLCFVLFASILLGAPPERPKIGLALAGGSSLGLAHVGVIKWLEENRIPVDAIAGASMGSLVGGLYATGRSAQDIENFVVNLDWGTALQPSTPFRQLAFRRKEDRREFPNRLDMGFKGKTLHLPLALSAGHGVGLVISRIAAGYSQMKSFDDLPIPFRSVAVDLTSAKQVEFSSGDLYEALRASMALPAVFSPQRRGDQMLVDGGILNNLPVDVTRSMGAEIVIAVALHVPLPKRGQSYSIFGVFDRTLDIMLSGTEVRALAQADIGIIPDLQSFTSAEFNRVKEFIERGYQATAAKGNVLRRFALSEEDWAIYQKARQARRRDLKFDPEFVISEGLNQPLEQDLARRLGAAMAPPADLRLIDNELTRIAGLGRWETASYRMIEKDGKQGLLIKAQEKEHGPPFLNTAILIDGANSQTPRFGIGGRLTFLDVLNAGSEWRTDFFLGFRDVLSTEYFHRVRSKKFFIAPRAFVEKTQLDLYDHHDRVAQFTTRETGAAIDLGYAAGRFSEFRLGYQLSEFRNSVSIGVPTLPSLRGNVSRVRTRWVYEGQDSSIVATKGLRFATNAQWIFNAPGGAKDGFPILEADLRWAKPLRGRYILATQAAGGSTVTSENLFSPFTLGGPLRLSALAPQQFYGSHYYFSSVGLLWALSEKPTQYFTRLYLTAGYEVGSAFNKGGRYKPFNDGVAGLVGQTPIGVLFVGGAYGEQGQRKIFVRLGRYF
jgi:NTE family protein